MIYITGAEASQSLESASVTRESQAPADLPVRERAPLPGGRHRWIGPTNLPRSAPALVLVTPIAASADGQGFSGELMDVARTTYPDADVRLAHLGEGQGNLAETLSEVSAGRPDTAPAAVVIPLLTGPHQRVYDALTATIAASNVNTTLTEPLGPHPLLADALHARLADSGLARADRVRLMSIGSPVDGVVVATVGEHEAVRAADVTAVLLAARLAVPVVCASLDSDPDVAQMVARLRETGASRIAIAPCLVGLETDVSYLDELAGRLNVSCARPLGAHPSVARLVTLRYEMALDELEPALLQAESSRPYQGSE